VGFGKSVNRPLFSREAVHRPRTRMAVRCLCILVTRDQQITLCVPRTACGTVAAAPRADPSPARPEASTKAVPIYQPAACEQLASPREPVIVEEFRL
jgi:hypothetical protein